MQRNVITDALVLSVSQLGENNRSVCFLSPETGISYGILYGGPKSKLRGLVTPFSRGKMYLYNDNIKKTTKISDFDVTNFHISFRSNLFKTWAATLAAELAIKTRCGGSPEECWYLVNGFLDGLELTEEENGKLGLIRFLWRYLGLLGVRPETDCCASCGQPFLFNLEEKLKMKANCTDEENVNYGKNDDKGLLLNNSNDDGALFDISEEVFHCRFCGQQAASIFVGTQAMQYLTAVSEKSPKEVRAMQCSVQAVNEMRQLVFHLIEAAVGQKLKTIETGLGIL